MYRKHFRIRSCQTFLGLVTDPSRCLWILNRILWRGRIRSQNQIRNPATHALVTTSIRSIWVLSTHHHECMYVLTPGEQEDEETETSDAESLRRISTASSMSAADIDMSELHFSGMNPLVVYCSFKRRISFNFFSLFCN